MPSTPSTPSLHAQHDQHAQHAQSPAQLPTPFPAQQCPQSTAQQFSPRSAQQPTQQAPTPVLASLTAPEVHRLLHKHRCKAFLLMVRPTDTPPTPPPSPDLSHADPETRAQVEALIAEFADIFPPELPPGLPPNILPHRVAPLLPGATPQYKQRYRLSPQEKLECDNQVKELLAKGLIEPSCSPWGAPVLFVVKKDGTLRACFDYRALNSVTIKNRFPLPRIDDIIDQFGGATVFSNLDLTQGYNQFQLLKEDQELSAFTTPSGHYQWRVLSFGLCNAPSAFSRAMQEILQPYVGKFVLIYLDDIAILSKSKEEHLQQPAPGLSTALRQGHPPEA